MRNDFHSAEDVLDGLVDLPVVAAEHRNRLRLKNTRLRRRASRKFSDYLASDSLELKC